MLFDEYGEITNENDRAENDLRIIRNAILGGNRAVLEGGPRDPAACSLREGIAGDLPPP